LDPFVLKYRARVRVQRKLRSIPAQLSVKNAEKSRIGGMVGRLEWKKGKEAVLF
jgi:hypothetical protein